MTTFRVDTSCYMTSVVGNDRFSSDCFMCGYTEFSSIPLQQQVIIDLAVTTFCVDTPCNMTSAVGNRRFSSDYFMCAYTM